MVSGRQFHRQQAERTRDLGNRPIVRKGRKLLRREKKSNLHFKNWMAIGTVAGVVFGVTLDKLEKRYEPNRFLAAFDLVTPFCWLLADHRHM